MFSNGNLKIVLLGIVGSVSTGIGGLKHYLGSSIKAMSHEERTKRKLRSCSIYEAEGFNLNLTESGARINKIKYSGNAEKFLSKVTRELDKKFKRDIRDRCVELFDSKSINRNIYVGQGKSSSFELGTEKGYYTPILQKTDGLKKARQNLENKGGIPSV